MIVVCDLVSQIGHLGFEAGLLFFYEATAYLAQLLGIRQRAMLEYAFARFESEIQSIKRPVALLECIDHAQALEIMLEATKILHAGIERVLTRMTEGRVTKIMCQRDRFDQVFIEPQVARQRACYLGDFDAVREAGSEQIAFVIDKNLGLVFKPTKCGGMNDAVAVALKFTSRRRR